MSDLTAEEALAQGTAMVNQLTQQLFNAVLQNAQLTGDKAVLEVKLQKLIQKALDE